MEHCEQQGDDEPRVEEVVSGGVVLAVERWGSPDGPAVVLLHGGGQTRHAFRRVARFLAAQGCHVRVPDLRGHGDSGWSPDGAYPLARFADDVRTVCAGFRPPVILMGASLGGLSALLAAGEAPSVPLAGLSLVDVAHRAEQAGVSRILGFMRAHPNGFESFDQVVSLVRSYLPHREAQRNAEGLRRNLRERGGRLVWHWDPRLLDSIDEQPDMLVASVRILSAARAVEAPIQLVRGAQSDVLSREIAEEFCREVPGTSLVDVAGARHMVAGDQNDPFLEALSAFVTRVAALAT